MSLPTAPTGSELGRQLAALSTANQPHKITCPVCGAVVTVHNVRAVYCGNRCRQVAKRRRRERLKTLPVISKTGTLGLVPNAAHVP